LIEINKNLHQSRAGIGRRLNTQRLIEIIAQIITIKTIPALSEFATKSTIPIGHFMFCTASILSSGVSGFTSFFTNIQIALKVSRL